MNLSLERVLNELTATSRRLAGMVEDFKLSSGELGLLEEAFQCTFRHTFTL